MKKIFSKLTVNRREEFQIETSIRQSEDGKRVYKRALNEKAKAHVNKLYDYYSDSKRKDRLCPVHPVKDGEVYFDFVTGSSMNEALLAYLKQGDKPGFQELMQNYRRFVEDSCELYERPAEPDAACEEVFGTSTWDFPGTYGRNLNIDLCFDNILVQNQQEIVIDYEWIFPMILPVNFVIYRSIWALYVKNAEIFRNQYTWQELYESLGMTEEEVSVYESMNEYFNVYVYGGEESYNQILPQYKKHSYKIGEPAEQQHFLLQIYADRGDGYAEEESYKEEMSTYRVSREIDVSMLAGAVTLRVDPCNVPFICKNMRVELTDTLGQRYGLKADQSNGFTTEQGMTIFTDGDPQMLYQKTWQGEPQKLCISYEVQCLLQGEELERYRCIVADCVKSREAWMWYEQETKRLQELAKPWWKKILSGK
ncbi:MAG: hypothetical protein ACI4DO_09115 [Roseburia sp.]